MAHDMTRHTSNVGQCVCVCVCVQIIYGHRAIIRTRSSFFDKLFTQTSASGMDPKGPYVIPETTREAFIEVLSYLYSGNTNLTVDNVQVCPLPPRTLCVRGCLE